MTGVQLDTQVPRFPVVALVCSAGGLDALIRVLAPLPKDFPAAVIALQHHRPNAPSLLAPLLGQRTALPVAEAVDGDPLVPGRVVVTPTGHHLLVSRERRLVLILSGPAPPYRPSADLLLASLALAVGRDAIAVVLSGYGIDGATGATVVHHLGGRVVASDAATSTVFGMPEATINRDRLVEAGTNVDDIGPLLVRMVSGRVDEASPA
jgi:two-component system, chemotaxis family, protein-glutamate methylesterase/glutaminase